MTCFVPLESISCVDNGSFVVQLRLETIDYRENFLQNENSGTCVGFSVLTRSSLSEWIESRQKS